MKLLYHLSHNHWPEDEEYLEPRGAQSTFILFSDAKQCHCQGKLSSIFSSIPIIEPGASR